MGTFYFGGVYQGLNIQTDAPTPSFKSLSLFKILDHEMFECSDTITNQICREMKSVLSTLLKESDSSRKCVWWDFKQNEFKGGWSSLGCRYDGKVNGRDVCLCDHLTNFAVLLVSLIKVCPNILFS